VVPCYSSPSNSPTMAPNLLFLFWGTGILNKGIVLARHAPYHLSHTSSPFCLAIFQIESHAYCPSLLLTPVLLPMSPVQMRLQAWATVLSPPDLLFLPGVTSPPEWKKAMVEDPHTACSVLCGTHTSLRSIWRAPCCALSLSDVSRGMFGLSFLFGG
jgi:hypothetical protein